MKGDTETQMPLAKIDAAILDLERMKEICAHQEDPEVIQAALSSSTIGKRRFSEVKQNEEDQSSRNC